MQLSCSFGQSRVLRTSFENYLSFTFKKNTHQSFSSLTSILSFLFDIPQTIMPASVRDLHRAAPIPTGTEIFNLIHNVFTFICHANTNLMHQSLLRFFLATFPYFRDIKRSQVVRKIQ